jgi:CheY-like chemotaxis protein
MLVVEDDDRERKSIVELIGNCDIETTAVGTAKAALTELESRHFDCIVLDLGLPDMQGYDLIETIKQRPECHDVPIIVYTGKDLTRKQETLLKKSAESVIIKDVQSPERLLDEITLFLHRAQTTLPVPSQRMLEELHKKDPLLAGKKILIVDDDVRNIFAITSVLECHEMTVLHAENGKDGLAILERVPGVDVVLMDIMMPEMDGYEVMRAIRQQERLSKLPIVALTAKAMKADRDKCVEAGASDYLAKPVDVEQLLSKLRVWLYNHAPR